MSSRGNCQLSLNDDHDLSFSKMKSMTVQELVLQDTESCCWSEVSCDDLLDDDITCMGRQEPAIPTTQKQIIRNLRWKASNHSNTSVDSPPICYGNERLRPAEQSHISKDSPFRAPIRSTEKDVHFTTSSPPLSRWSSMSTRLENDNPRRPRLQQKRESYCEDASEVLQRTVCLLDAALEIAQNH
ncbi:hypothetical protein IV203_010913 [Nitzschia inconspicua]|uniref:Uncharacterized protein n=1 Tax=Nitzschia inconspicua TaxID=303405 RepID=A0A9K3PLD0_9STRA|nr:hypothetical protein IV203_010913 [Nitzschia inconspicua]